MPQGVYLHIPFCSSFCSYCDFYREPYSPQAEQAYVSALLSEIELRAAELGAQEVTSVYFGGGTPSLLHSDSWRRLFGVLREHCRFSPDCEISAEANPDSVDVEKLTTLRESGVNRLSLGAQSFSNRALQALGRRHDAAAIKRAVSLARDCDFANLSLDLLLGLPASANTMLRDDLQALLEFTPEHLSCYVLTLEGGVQLQLAVEQGSESLPEEQQIADDYLLLAETMQCAGYEHYEISNFAKPGFACRHNLNYWQQGEYLGFGPAAVTTSGDLRSTNVPDLRGYLQALNAGKLPERETETLDDRTRCAERIMLS
ncbi:MAG: radical SAM family heme chaperone HemW, partial [bacterium]